MAKQQGIQSSIQSTNLADLLERILDKGIVIAGDIKIRLVEVELLTLQIRLVICSVDKAKELGIDWWVANPAFNSRPLRKNWRPPLTRSTRAWGAWNLPWPWPAPEFLGDLGEALLRERAPPSPGGRIDGVRRATGITIRETPALIKLPAVKGRMAKPPQNQNWTRA